MAELVKFLPLKYEALNSVPRIHLKKPVRQLVTGLASLIILFWFEFEHWTSSRKKKMISLRTLGYEYIPFSIFINERKFKNVNCGGVFWQAETQEVLLAS